MKSKEKKDLVLKLRKWNTLKNEPVLVLFVLVSKLYCKQFKFVQVKAKLFYFLFVSKGEGKIAEICLWRGGI